MVPLEDLMAIRLGTVNPEKYPEEVFELYSIPAYDSRQPEVATGSQIGSAKQVVQPRDVLLSKIVPHIRRSWIVGDKVEYRLIASGEWIVFRSNRVVPEYLRHVLLGDAFHAKFMQTVSGVGGSLLRARPSQVAKITIPLPPLPEQRRIAAILDKADALRVKRREALAQLESLAQSIFVDVFGDALQTAERTPLCAFVDEFRYGTSNKSGATGFPALRIPNVVGGALDLRELKTVNVDASEFSRLKLVDGDLLFVRTNGNRDNVGRCTVFSQTRVANSGFEVDSFIYASYLIRARLKSEQILPTVLQFFLSTEEGRRELRSYSKTSAGQFNINTEGLGALRIPNFPMALQESFVEKLEAVERQRHRQRKFGEDLDALFTSLQHRAFRGEL